MKKKMLFTTPRTENKLKYWLENSKTLIFFFFFVLMCVCYWFMYSERSIRRLYTRFAMQISFTLFRVVGLFWLGNDFILPEPEVLHVKRRPNMYNMSTRNYILLFYLWWLNLAQQQQQLIIAAILDIWKGSKFIYWLRATLWKSMII